MRITNISANIPHQLLRRLMMVFILTFAAAERPSLIGGQWQPPGALSGVHYVGSKVCASCHVTESAVQPDTPMAQTLSPVTTSQVLQSHPHLSGQLGRYSYQIVTESGKTTYIVSDGINSITETLLWAVGHGGGGQSYLYSRDERFYEARVSYFSEIGNLDLTLGHPHTEPAGLDEAAGRPLTDSAVLKCFNCHSTGAEGESGLQLAHRTPGITCEKCHGPGREHLAAVQSGDMNNLHIFNHGHMKLDEQVCNFCGSCHRNAFDVANNKASGIVTIRFEPYRLVLSRCYDSRDPRISCIACHNSHNQMSRTSAFYDAMCLACHGGSDRPSPASKIRAVQCRVATENCVTCHMPKLELPGDHFKFADHDIRIVRPGEPFPG
ncbi:MAG TPA: multiheme c-type cytochrome [Terriglobia bacterium]|nr:multiheme c-type cytochrome [Terriglobia bacterium]